MFRKINTSRLRISCRFKVIIVCFLFTILSLQAFSQEFKNSKKIDYLYDDDLLSKEIYKARRESLRALMPENSVAVFFANPIRNRSNDVDFEFHQDPNLYYLTGFTESDAVLFIFKSKQDLDSVASDELIFVPERNPKVEQWTGRKLGTNGVQKTLGITAAANTHFADSKIDFTKFAKVLSVPTFNDVRDDEEKGNLYSLINKFKEKQVNTKTDVSLLNDYMSQLREIKSKEEIVLMKKTIDMTCAGFDEMIKALEPGMTEYQTEAIVEYFFKKNGAEYEGYPSICGAAENSTVLHYSTNRRKLKGNEMLVVDAGAEYHGYSADVTRTIPVDGNYSTEEKAIYNLVLEAQMAGIAECKESNQFLAPHKAATAVIKKGLMDLGIIKTETDYRKYFMHGTSHYLGLDVHDAGMYGKLKAGNVITVEPGIYIAEGSDCDPKWWNIGVRIEDDVLITVSNPIIMSDCIPKKVEDIEALMKQSSSFNK